MRSAVSALTLLKNESAGQSELLVVDGSQESANFTMPAGVTPLYQLISSDGLDNALRYLLARYVAVRDLDAAQSLLSFDPALIAVTQDGDLVSRNRVRGGSSAANSAIEIGALLDKTRDQLNEVSGEAEKLAFELARIKQNVESAQSGYEVTLAKLNDSDARMSRSEEHTSELQSH